MGHAPSNSKFVQFRGGARRKLTDGHGKKGKTIAQAFYVNQATKLQIFLQKIRPVAVGNCPLNRLI